MDNKKIMSELKKKFQNLGTEAVHPTGTDESDFEMDQKLPHYSVQCLGNGTVTLDRDKSGKLDVKVKETQKLSFDGSWPGKIAEPKSDQAVKTETEMCLRLLEFIKKKEPPGGVVFDKTKVTLAQGKKYREGEEYEYVQQEPNSRDVEGSEEHQYTKEPIPTMIKQVLGQGNHGDILVVRDRGTNAVHAEKTIMISQINPNDIRCWVDLMETGNVPQLYMFRIKEDAVVINMERLEKAKTLDQVKDEEILRKGENADLLNVLYEKGWAHKYLHMTLPSEKSGKVDVQFTETQRSPWDGSDPCKRAEPKSDIGVKSKTEMCLQLLEYIKKNKPPGGVLFDQTKVTLSQDKKYREGEEFEYEYVHQESSNRDQYTKEPIPTMIKQVLGQGIHGDILVVRDRGTNVVHAEKTIMISTINPNEIRCWVDLMETGVVPQLFMFRIKGDAVVINMKRLEKAKTIDEIIDEENLRKKENAELLKPFSLYVLDGTLDALCVMHKKGWVHNDLHRGNVMTDNELKIKIIDFGCASKNENSAKGVSLFQHDIINAVRLFTFIFCGQYFKDIHEFKKDSHAIIDKMAGLPNKDKEIIFAVIEKVLKITNLPQLEEFKQGVNDIMRKEMGDSRKTILKRVAVLLFPDKFLDLHPEKKSAVDDADRLHDEADCVEDEADCIGAKAEYIGDETFAMLPNLDSVAAKITDQQINELCRQYGNNL